jgi:hypothetical protein
MRGDWCVLRLTRRLFVSPVFGDVPQDSLIPIHWNDVMNTIPKLNILLVSLTFAAPVFAQSDPHIRADRKITGAAYRSNTYPGYRHEAYQPYAPQYVGTYAPAAVVTAPAPAPAAAVVTENGSRSYRSFSYDPVATAPAYVPATQPVYVQFSQPVYGPRPQSRWTHPTLQEQWRADRKITGAVYRR